MFINFMLSAVLSVVVSQAALAEAADGALLYQRNCAVCHGMNGDGGVGIPLNLKDFQAVASDYYLRATLREGRPGRVMPAFPGLSSEQVSAIIGHLRSWSDAEPPIYTAETFNGQPERGKTLFASHCADCHGDSGQGGIGYRRDFFAPQRGAGGSAGAG